MQMRKSRVLEKLRSGGVATCFKMNLADSRACEIAAMSGFDCLWTDMEHVPNDWSVIERQIMAAKMHDVDMLVRVSRGGYSDYIRPLEMDATGIMVPHIMSYEDAQTVVRNTKFHPVGRRPLDGGNSDGSYCAIPLSEYMTQANSERFLVVQIEDPEPMEELEKICSLDGIDMIFFGPGDFSQGIGTPGQWDNPEIDEARKKIAKTAAKFGKYAGTVGGVQNFDRLVDMGYNFVSMGADVVGLSRYCREIISAVSEKAESLKNGLYDK